MLPRFRHTGEMETAWVDLVGIPPHRASVRVPTLPTIGRRQRGRGGLGQRAVQPVGGADDQTVGRAFRVGENVLLGAQLAAPGHFRPDEADLAALPALALRAMA